MSETLSNDVLRRKARAGRDEHQARVMSPARAMRLALSRAADELFELAVNVSGVQCELLGQDGMLRTVDDDMLLIVLDGPDGAVGAVAVDLAILAGFIEQQTMGHVIAGEPVVRAPTSTDAALIAPLINMFLSGVTDNLGAEDGRMTEGFEFGARLDSKRHLGLLVAAPDFHVLRAQLELGEGAKRGEFVLIVPVYEARDLSEADEFGSDATTVDQEAPRKVTFADSAMMDAEACLRAVISRQKMTLGALGQLKPGDLIDLPADALSKVHLSAGQAQRLGPCTLGQYDGFRAVQLRFAVRDDARHPAEAVAVNGLFTEDMPTQATNDAPSPAQAITAPIQPPDLGDLPGFDDLLSEAS